MSFGWFLYYLNVHSIVRQFLAAESPLKIIRNAFYFMLNAFLVLKKFLSRCFGGKRVGKRFDKKAKVNFKIYDVIDRIQII